MKRLWILVALLGTGALAAAPPAPQADMQKLEQLTGAKPQWDAKEQVMKVSLPRADLSTTVGGVKLTPALGLTSWAAFKKVNGHYLVMGDQVLAEDQVNPVMSAALDSGLEVTALHNHFFWAAKPVFYMHIGGMGSLDALGGAIGKVFALAKQTGGGKGGAPQASIDPANTRLDTKKLDAVFGKSTQLKDGVYKYVWGRETRMHGAPMGNAMGVNTWAAFAGTDQQAVVDGDFAMLEGEVQNVLKALRSHDLNIVAIHNHMIGESPRIVFLHFWGVGPAVKLAEGVEAGLAQTSTNKKTP